MPQSVLSGGPTLPQVRRLVTAIPGPNSLALTARMAKAVAHPVTPTMPVFAAAAGGGVVVDVDGNSLIDFGCGIAVTTVGNAAPGVVEAVQAQVASFTHTAYSITPYEGYIRVAERLADLTPGDFEKRTMLANSGAEAVENAVKIARWYTKRDKIVVFENAFHGRTNLTMAMTHKEMPYKAGFGPFTPDLFRAAMSYPFRDQLSGPEAAERAIAQIEAALDPGTIACLVIEPIQGEGGFVVPAPGFMAALSAWCTAHGVIFIADEIQSGMARTGDMFASTFEGVVPDLVTIAKGVAGGLPLSAVTGRAEIMDAAQPGGLGGTYGGNPVACAAALAVMDMIKSDGLLARARQIGAILTGRLKAFQASDPRIGDVRGRGAMQAIEFVKPGTLDPDPALASAVAKYAHSQGVIMLTCGTYSNVVRLLPPLSISDDLLTEGLDILGQALVA
ncbi:MAG: 4-aminobutyrate--2-oxoglutarate transaminase [Propionibacteriaceae bacterium]|nr:4-aminobutyrate--2-oxoglutarate transaminase [Propionibacteriaceae bacterium]